MKLTFIMTTEIRCGAVLVCNLPAIRAKKFPWQKQH